MPTTIVFKKSNVAGKEPSDLQPAELAINLKDQKLFTADTDGNIIELGGGGATPGPLPPDDKEPGDLWYDSDNNTLNYWNGSDWVQLEASTGSNVDSVNGKSGVVVLTYTDVGAASAAQGAKADTAIQPGVVNPVYFASQAAFPDAASPDVHGGVAHSHADGAMFFAHNGTWNEMANSADLSNYVPLGSWASIPALT